MAAEKTAFEINRFVVRGRTKDWRYVAVSPHIRMREVQRIAAARNLNLERILELGYGDRREGALIDRNGQPI